MRHTTQADPHSSTATPADSGPYPYSPLVAHGGGLPAPAPPAAQKSKGWKVAETVAACSLSFSAWLIESWLGWRIIQGYMLAVAVLIFVRYFAKPQPKQNFSQWLLRQVGIWLNCYIGFVTVPESLRGLHMDDVAFGLPAFLITTIMYVVAPIKPGTGQKWPFWQWLLFAVFCGIFWSGAGPILLHD